jgi:hypothetical protein
MSAVQQDERADQVEDEEAKADDPSMVRAEEIVDRLGEQFGRFAAETGQRLRKWTARAGEEAEDIWAEAQHLRGGGQE